MSQWEKLLVDAGLEDHKADWNKWKHIPRVTVGEACLLSMGIDPDVVNRESRIPELVAELKNKLRHPTDKVREFLALYESLEGCKYRVDGWGNTVQSATFEAGSEIGKFTRELDVRTDWAMNNLESEGGNLKVHGSKYGRPSVGLSDFGTWANGMDWDLPSEFPIGEAEGAFSFDPDSETYPRELDIAFQAWRAVAINGHGGTGNPKARIRAWLGSNYSNLLDAEKHRISTVCNWDKKGGNKSSRKG